ncbi:MAG: bifunctional folylpolyglutamate synthase/dihydrofolate synthase [Lachnospiraceae bacterium]|nr:bifunctional folylpolyglutamate synthase/dihydrofolate synthase [Lachnospiraceae bacterium]
MKEKEYLEYIEYLNTLGSRPGLASITELCASLSDPQEELKIIHIAGTNGKGSILAMLTEILMAHGLTVGTYTSPAILDYRERFCINKKMITKKALGEYFSVLKEHNDALVSRGLPHPTSFETETALAFLYFRDQKTDVCIIETGMGGRLDATNIIKKPILTVFASIGMDHMQFLGNSLEAIAKEKAGILKEGCPAVSSEQDTRAKNVLFTEAGKLHCPIAFADSARRKDKAGTKPKFDYAIGETMYKNMTLSLIGTWQYQNAMTVLEACHALNEHCGYMLETERIRKALQNVTWPARLEKIGTKPDFYIDGAHNEPAALELAKSIEQYFTNKQIIYIIGVLKDKDYEAVIEATYPYAEAVVTLKPPNNPRALDAYTLAQVVSRYHKRVMNTDSIEEAVEMARLLAGERKDVMILAFGSLSYLGRLREIVQNEKGARKRPHG